MKYEIPVTIFNENGEPTYGNYFGEGSYSEVSNAADALFASKYKDYDYTLVQYHGKLDHIKPELIVTSKKGAKEAVVERDIYDDMEDLQDRYYTLMDRLNSIPASAQTKDPDVQAQIGDAQFHLNEAKDYFDQYDFSACKDALDQAEKSISLVQKKQVQKISNEHFAKRAIEDIESTPEVTIKFGQLSEAIKAENDTVVLYQTLMQQYPDWANVLQDIIDEELKHVGQLEDLRNKLTGNIGQQISEGEAEGRQQLAEESIALEDLDAEELAHVADDDEDGYWYAGDYGQRIKYLIQDLEDRGVLRRFIEILDQEFGIDWDTEEESWAEDIFKHHGGDPGDGICVVADTTFICSKDKKDCWTVDEGDPEETMELLLNEPKMERFLKSNGLVVDKE